MSDSRKVLTAKRKHERSKGNNFQNYSENFDAPKRGTKRPGFSDTTPKKNLANDRLKRLRTSLNEEVQKSKEQKKKPLKGNERKRPQNDVSFQTIAVKQHKQHETTSNKSNAFVFKNVQQKNFSFGANTSCLFNQCDSGTSSKAEEDMEWCSVPVQELPDCPFAHNSSLNVQNNGTILIVVDTNIFLSSLQTIKDIMSLNVTGNITPVIFIPWIVIEELDFIKEDTNNSNVKFKAREAIKFVEKSLSSKHDRIKGQTLDEVNQQKSTGKSQDNKIIASCLQILERQTNIILLTNDVNLKNKAHFNNIPVCSNTEIMSRLSRLNKTKFEIIMSKMTTLCSRVINECARKAYGAASSKMPICQTSLKSMEDCISIITKYWFPVFQEVLMKQFRKAIDDLSIYLNKNKNINDDQNGINELVRLCIRVCLFLKDVESCKNAIESTIRDLNNIKDS